MSLTSRQLNRATLQRQLLLRRERVGVHGAIRQIMAIQAQEPASPYVALWNRIDGFEAADLDAAFADHSVVKATLMRVTLHAVRAEDHTVLHHAMRRSLRAARIENARFAASGLSAEDVDAELADLLTFLHSPRTNAEIDAHLVERLGPATPTPWWALRAFAPVVHAPTGGPWSFGARPSYRAARAGRYRGDETSALTQLIRHYLKAFGPASVKDIAQFGKLYVPPLRAAFDAIRPELVELDGPDGVVLYDVADGVMPDADLPAPPRLMAMWDSTLLAYADRGRIVPPEYRQVVTRNNGDTLPTLLVDGHVAGVWRPVDGGIEASTFHPLSDADWDGLALEAAALARFLADRDPQVYRRYARWWATLPVAQTRVLPC